MIVLKNRMQRSRPITKRTRDRVSIGSPPIMRIARSRRRSRRWSHDPDLTHGRLQQRTRRPRRANWATKSIRDSIVLHLLITPGMLQEGSSRRVCSRVSTTGWSGLRIVQPGGFRVRVLLCFLSFPAGATATADRSAGFAASEEEEDGED
jgi:hypothetical protein